MNPKPLPLWQRGILPRISPFRFVLWFFRWRNLRRCLFALACLATSIAIFYAEENWRGHRAWEKFKREWEAKGEVFDFQALLPPPVPDDQNFAMTPFWADARAWWEARQKGQSIPQSLLDRLNHATPGVYHDYNTLRGTLARPDLGSWREGTNTDLKAWQAYYRAPLVLRGGRTIFPTTNDFPIPAKPGVPAEDVLLALSKYSGDLDQLRAAATMPHSQFPGNFEDGPYGADDYPLNRLWVSSQFLHVHAIAELDSGKMEPALGDIKLMFYLADSIKSQPSEYAFVERGVMYDRTLDVIWEGMGGHRWTEPQLKSFQEQIGTQNLLAHFLLGARGDRARSLFLLDDLSSRRMGSPFAPGRKGDTPLLEHLLLKHWDDLKKSLYIRFAPHGWFEQEKVMFAQPYAEELAAIDPQAGRIDLKQMAAIEPAFKAPESRPFLLYHELDWGERDTEPGPLPLARRAVQQQTSLNLAAVACALERYWAVKNKYPEKLDELVPQFITKLPHEIVGGGPLHYRRSDDGRFVLYSVGIEGNDSGGIYRAADGKRTGNLVWRYPAK